MGKETEGPRFNENGMRKTGWDKMTHTVSAWTKQKAAVVLEWLFLLVTGIYLICQCVYQSTYVLPAYTFPDRAVFQMILCAAAVFALGNTLLSGLWSFRTGLLALTGVAFFLAYRTGRELFLLMIPVLMAGTAGVDYKKVLRVYLAAVGSFLAVTVLCTFTGVIPNIVGAGGGRFRSSWGIAYPTDFASLVLFFVMMLWLLWEQMPTALAVLSAFLSLWISLVITGSRTSALCSLLFLAFILYHMIWVKKLSEKSRISKFGKGVQLLMVFSFLLFAVAYFLAVMLYAKGTKVGAAFDRLFSYRLYMTLMILRDQGISAFGSNYPQIGLGGITIQSEAYYFLDSSYAMLLIRYGWVPFVTTAALWTGMGFRAYRAGDQKLLCIMTMIAFHAMSEHHFPDVQYNMLLVLPFASITQPKHPIPDNIKFKEKLREKWAVVCCAAVLLAAAVLVTPPVLDRLRTVFDFRGTDSAQGEIQAVLWCALLLLAAGTSGWMLCQGAVQLQKHQVLNKKTAVGLAVGLTVLLGIMLMDSRVIRQADEPGRINPEKAEAMERILELASGRVVANKEPELMHRHFPGISRSVWYGQDLARQENISAVVDLEEDNHVFSKMGFQFTQISPDDAVYSNDPSVIKGLTEAGYQWTAYDVAVREVDLGAFAALNGLSLTEKGSVVLENGGKLNHGPYLDFYNGTYRITFELKANGSTERETSLCSLYVATLEGQSLTEKTVEQENLRTDGTCSVELVFETDDIRYLQFPVFPAEGQSIEVTGIRFQRIG